MTVVHQNLDGTVIVEIRRRCAVAVESGRDARTCLKRDVFKRPVVFVPAKRFAFPERNVQPSAIYFRVDMAISHEQVRPTIVVNIDEESPPSQELLTGSKSREISDVSESAIAVVVIQRGSFVRKIRSNNVQPAVAIVVNGVGAHAGNFMAILTVSNAGPNTYLCECAVMIVVIQKARSGVTSDEDVWPAVPIKISSQCCEAIMFSRFGDPGFIAYIGDRTVAIVVI